MVFLPPSWVPKLTHDPPDSITTAEFMLDEKHGRMPWSKSKNPFTCGLTGRTYTGEEMVQRVDHLARALSKELGWLPNKGTEWDKVAGVFTLNTVDSMTLNYAIHRLSGISSPANAAYSAAELEFQLKSSTAKCLFTCIPLLETSLKAAKSAGIPKSRVYILEMPKQFSGDQKLPFKTVGDFIEQGSNFPPLEPLKWEKGQGSKQTAYLCYSSGTSGLPKGVMISHRNVIANVMQMKAFEKPARDKKGDNSTEVCLGLLPLSHIYGLVAVAQSSTYRGDGVIILPKFELDSFLQAIQTHKITFMYLVPPIIIQLVKSQAVCKKYDQSSVTGLFTGAAPMTEETAQDLQKIYPSWSIRQGYGLTETCTVACATPEHDVFFGSCGSLLPGFSAKIVSSEGVEITGYDEPGELVLQSPTVVLGYLNNDQANKETFLDDTDGKGRWMRTGDEAVVRKNPKSGNEHIFIVDRIKELIKVKGLQVAPAELEGHLLSHPAVADCAVIPIPDDAAGELPKAYVVKSNSVGLEENDRSVQRSIMKYVEEHKARHKWLKGGVEFIDEIPKSPSGKILRRLLRDKEKEERRKKGSKL